MSRNKDVLLKNKVHQVTYTTIKHTSPIKSFKSKTTKAILSYKLH